MKKHQAVMGEMAQHEARVEAVRAAGAALRDAGHFAADDIAARLQHLQQQWTQLQEKALQVFVWLYRVMPKLLTYFFKIPIPLKVQNNVMHLNEISK